MICFCIGCEEDDTEIRDCCCCCLTSTDVGSSSLVFVGLFFVATGKVVIEVVSINTLFDPRNTFPSPSCIMVSIPPDHCSLFSLHSCSRNLTLDFLPLRRNTKKQSRCAKINEITFTRYTHFCILTALLYIVFFYHSRPTSHSSTVCPIPKTKLLKTTNMHAKLILTYYPEERYAEKNTNG